MPEPQLTEAECWKIFIQARKQGWKPGSQPLFRKTEIAALEDFDPAVNIDHMSVEGVDPMAPVFEDPLANPNKIDMGSIEEAGRTSGSEMLDLNDV